MVGTGRMKDTKVKAKAVPLQAWSGPEGSRKLRFPDYMTPAQDGGKAVSLTHWPPLPQEMLLVFLLCVVLFVIRVVLLLLLMFYVLFMCKCVLPPGVNPIAVDKYINININTHFY
jgi:hypothetical protein